MKCAPPRRYAKERLSNLSPAIHQKPTNRRRLTPTRAMSQVRRLTVVQPRDAVWTQRYKRGIPATTLVPIAGNGTTCTFVHFARRKPSALRSCWGPASAHYNSPGHTCPSTSVADFRPGSNHNTPGHYCMSSVLIAFVRWHPAIAI
jgi:hypothetical protein